MTLIEFRLLAGLGIAAAAVLLSGIAILLWRARRMRSPYEFVRRLGRGDLSDVHAARRNDELFVLKIPRVAGQDGLVEKEFSLLKRLRQTAAGTRYLEYLPAPVEDFDGEGRRVNVFRWREGFLSLEELRERFPTGLEGRHLAWIFNRTLEVLGFVHRAGWVHGAVLPPHLLVHPESHGLMLVDWIHAEPAGGTLRLVPALYADWYPAECRGRQPLTPSADLYLAAQSIVFLAGGDPLRRDIPKSIPAGIRRVLRACLLESPRMRCQDAWQVRDEFGAVLEGVYGPPRFQPLILE